MAVLTNREKVSVFLAILGPEISAKILRYLPEEMALLIASGVNKIVPSKEAVSMVLRDFGRLFLTAGGTGPIPLKETNSTEKKELTFSDLIKDLTPKQWVSILSGERPQTVAFIFSQFPQVPINQIIPLFPTEIRLKLESRLKNIKKLEFTEILKSKIEKILKEKIKELSDGTDKKRAY